MFSIERLRDLITALEASERHYAHVLTDQPASFTARGMVKNARERLVELRAELVLHQRLRDREVIELRLVGPQAQQGRLPLSAISGLLGALEVMLREASYYVQYGTRRTAEGKQLVREALGLRFEQVLPGSSRILLTGNVAPNLFGESLLATGLDRTFALLQAPSNPTLEVAAARTGVKVVQGAKRLADTSLRFGMALALRWQPPVGAPRQWAADAPQLAFLSSRLSRLAEQQPETEVFQGQLITPSLRGWVDIRQGRRTHRATFPPALLEQVQAVPIGALCEGVWLKTTRRNEVTQEPNEVYQLLEFKLA